MGDNNVGSLGERICVARTLFILDLNLKNLQGHYFEYDRSVAQAAILKGLECIVLSHRDAALPPGLSFAAHPVYSADIWKTLPGEDYHSERNITAVSAAFASETLDFLANRPTDRGDILFLPTITKAQLPGAAALAEALGPRGVRLQIMLRYQRAFYDGPTATSAFRRLEEAAKRFSIGLCTDSHRLAQDLGTLTALPIQVFPIPHTDQLGQQRNASAEPTGAVHFVGLGDARGEKGLAEIFKAVRASARKPWADRARFTLQCNNPSADVVGAIEAFRKNPDPRVTLVDRVLNSEEYYALLQESDAVLVPYHRDMYRERTSGVFLEAVAAGKIVVCTCDTWMSDLLDVHGGGIAVADRSGTDLSAAIGEIVANFSNLHGRAMAAAAHWKTIHSPHNLVEHLLDEVKTPAIVQRRQRVAVIYPWGDAAHGRSGAVVRLRLLVKYLEQNYSEVRVLFTSGGKEEGGPITAKTVAEPYYMMRIRARLLYVVLERLSAMLGGDKGQSYHLWFHLWPRFDGRFYARCEEIIRWADDVYLEYSYFAPVVGRLCRRFGKRLVVTQYDIVSEQSKGVPLIYPATQRLEFGALKRAPRVVVCTDHERALCAARGIAAEVIVHPVGLSKNIALTTEEAAFILNALYAVPTEDRQICLFIGSAYPPNREAAQFIRSMATRLRDDPRAKDLVFVVVGACMAPVQEDNFMALGLIEEAGLSACYEMAAIVLVPLTEGTGSSIKSIEALALGAVVLSTSVGMRGIPIEPGRHCLIEEDLSAYPERILAILRDPEAAARLRAAAKDFGASYDFRTVFATYQLHNRSGSAHWEERAEEAAQHREETFRKLLPRARQLGNPAALEFILKRLSASDLFEFSKDQDTNESQEKVEGTIGELPKVQAQAIGDVQVESAPAVSEKRTLLRRILKSIALQIPQVRWLYQQAISKTAESAALNRANDELRESLRLASTENTDWQRKHDALTVESAALSRAYAGLPREYIPLLRKAVRNWEVDRPLDAAAYNDLLEASALARGAPCRWCNGSETILIQRVVSHYGNQSFAVWHCTGCGCRFTDGVDLPRVDYDGIGRRHAWYQLHHCDAEHVKNILDRGADYFWAFMAAKYLADVPWFPDRRYRMVLEQVLEARIQNRKLRVIEVGCGLGVLGGVVAHLGHDYLGVDVMSEEQSRVVERFGRFGARYRSVSADWFEQTKTKGSFDLVFSTEVIEHTAKPLDFLRRLVSLAEPGGEIILTTPDLDLNRHAVWATDSPPIHTVFLNREAVKLGVARLGEPLDVTIINEGGSFDWRRVRPKNAPPEAALVPAHPVQIDPSRQDFAYDVANVDFGLPRLDVLERPDRLSEHYQEQMVLASLENVRVNRGSMIIKIRRHGSSAHSPSRRHRAEPRRSRRPSKKGPR